MTLAHEEEEQRLHQDCPSGRAFYGQDAKSFEAEIAKISQADPRLLEAFKMCRASYLERFGN